MPKQEYDTIGGVWENEYGFNLKLELPNGEKLNLYFSEPHPDYKKDTSPKWFIKVKKDDKPDDDIPFS